MSTAALSWDAVLNMTKIELKLFSYADMYLLFEKSVIGRASFISKGYSKSNNKYLKSYDPKQEFKRIIYLGMNNLFGYGMSKFLPKVDLNR